MVRFHDRGATTGTARSAPLIRAISGLACRVLLPPLLPPSKTGNKPRPGPRERKKLNRGKRQPTKRILQGEREANRVSEVRNGTQKKVNEDERDCSGKLTKTNPGTDSEEEPAREKDGEHEKP